MVTKYRSHVILGQKLDGTELSVKGIIAEALDYAIANGAAIAYDLDTALDFKVPLYELKDQTVTEVISIPLRWAPESVGWWDYTVTPTKLYIKRLAGLTPVNIAVPGSPQAVQIKARRDLQRTAVVINYEVSYSINGENYQSLITDAWPADATGLEFGALVVTVNLQGPQFTFGVADVEVATIEAAAGSPAVRNAWWAARHALFADPDLDASSVSISQVQRGSSLPSELINGQIPDWVDVATEEETITATVKYKKTTDVSVRSQTIQVQVQATNATTQRYSQWQSTVPGESVPEDLAHKFYDAVNHLHYEGSIKLQEQECTELVKLGNVLNLTGGRAEWENMNAIVSSIEEDVDAGTTTVHFGPPQNLGIDDLIQLLQVNRLRQTITNPKAMSDGKFGNSSTIALGKKMPIKKASAGDPNYQSLIIKGDAGPATQPPPTTNAYGTIQISSQDAKGKFVKLREANVCITQTDGTEVTKKALVLMSDPY